MKHFTRVCVLAISVLFVYGCGGGEKEETEETKSTFGALKDFADKAEAMSKKEAVEPVSFQELKELLPATLSGIPRTGIEGEANDLTGFKISVAKGTYEEGDKTIDVDIMDLGGMGGLGVAGLAAWTLAESEKETAEGYEKTIKLDGQKAFEKYNNNTKDGELKLFFHDRYLISVDGRNVTMDEIKGAFRELNLSKLPKE